MSHVSYSEWTGAFGLFGTAVSGTEIPENVTVEEMPKSGGFEV